MAGESIVLYHYGYSPYARRVAWYLALRGIPYSQCVQPPMMPRPDISRLGISYRRIPILAIGRDVYLDTRLQIPKLEALFPELPRLGATEPGQLAVERLLSHFTNDGDVFNHAVQLLPVDLPLLNDPKYYKDRGDFIGGDLSKEGMGKNRPEALREVARALEFLETTLLADGRDWVLKTETPSLADIEAVWPFHWLTGLPGALPKDKFSADVYPRVYAWIQRFQEAISTARKKTGKPRTISGDEAAQAISQSSYSESEKAVDGEDTVVASQKLKRGDTITVWPTDTGSSHRDSGKLVGIDAQEVVWETPSVRVHAPRHGFGVRRDTNEGESAKL
ncbi:Fc.00g098720.m01.CDS01 [Cosmosporella sp. VM-42]